MATSPRFTRRGILGSVLVTAANTSSQGGGTIGTDIFLVTTADATEGSFISFVRWIPTATTPTNTTATVGRVFISTQSSGATTSANTYLIAEVVLPLTAADNATAAVSTIDIPINAQLTTSETILVTCHSAPAANTAWRATVFDGGDY